MCFNWTKNCLSPLYSLVRIVRLNPFEVTLAFDVTDKTIDFPFDPNAVRHMTRVTAENAKLIERRVLHTHNVQWLYSNDAKRHSAPLDKDAYRIALQRGTRAALSAFRRVSLLRWDAVRAYARLAGRLVTMHMRLKEEAYAPGGAGMERAQREFEDATRRM